MFRNLSKSFMLVCKKGSKIHKCDFLSHRIQTKLCMEMLESINLLQMFCNPQVAKKRT